MPELVFYLLVFLAVGSFFLFVHLLMGKFIRPSRQEGNKLTIYECGEPTVGSAWIQFDLRYYVVALLFVVFDVEVAFFFPWAVVFGNMNKLATTNISAEERANISTSLASPGRSVMAEASDTINAPTARSWAWVAFGDIMVFFGVLMVGFAYLWRRGDIDWVRSTSAEDEELPSTTEELPVLSESPTLVGAGKS